MNAHLSVNAKRLYTNITKLGTIGAYTDASTGLVGVCRLALSDEDRIARNQIVSWMNELGLEVGIDRIGNIYGVYEGDDPSLSPVMCGSHIDTVPTGGRFDGALGVLGGLEIVRTLIDNKVRTKRSICIAVFTDEEGCRFGTDMLGSAVATGRIALDDAYNLIDADGSSVRPNLRQIGYVGEEKPGLRKPYAYVECHVEQGPSLIRNQKDIGVVTEVQAISWFHAIIKGVAAHAGATPTCYRKDAGLVAAMINVKLRDMIESHLYGDMRATMGVISPEPNMVNVIPGTVECTIDLRNPNNELMLQSELAIAEYIHELEISECVQILLKQTARTPVVRFSAEVQSLISSAVCNRNLTSRSLYAGAGHDAQEWARLCPSGMIFVPGEYDGVSHNPRELSTQAQCANGINVLLDVIVELADRS